MDVLRLLATCICTSARNTYYRSDNPLGNLKIWISCQIRITGNPSNHPRIIRIILGYNRNIVRSLQTGNVSLTLADEIKKYKTDALIEFLQREEDLELDDLKVIREEKTSLRSVKRKKRSFSSYKTQKDLKEVLAKYGIDGNGIGAIRQFPPKTYTLEDDDEELK
uniref:Uncharacterized protein n=1 Tax=Rhizophagus irregularis (strain DAOM 181602 / DAOM 197198 / MUCL 43194) TaxID=747089 RepID=U9UVJ1_RHIID